MGTNSLISLIIFIYHIFARKELSFLEYKIINDQVFQLRRKHLCTFLMEKLIYFQVTTIVDLRLCLLQFQNKLL